MSGTATALLAAAMLLAAPAAQACQCGHGSPGEVPTDLIRVEDPEPLPDAPVTLPSRVAPQDRVPQGAPANADAPAPPPAPGLLQQAPAPPPHLQQPGVQKGAVDKPK